MIKEKNNYILFSIIVVVVIVGIVAMVTGINKSNNDLNNPISSSDSKTNLGGKATKTEFKSNVESREEASWTQTSNYIFPDFLTEGGFIIKNSDSTLLTINRDTDYASLEVINDASPGIAIMTRAAQIGTYATVDENYGTGFHADLIGDNTIGLWVSGTGENFIAADLAGDVILRDNEGSDIEYACFDESGKISRCIEGNQPLKVSYDTDYASLEVINDASPGIAIMTRAAQIGTYATVDENYGTGFHADLIGDNTIGLWVSGTGENFIAADLAGDVILRDNSGTGNAYACFDSEGKLFRSNEPCN